MLEIGDIERAEKLIKKMVTFTIVNVVIAGFSLFVAFTAILKMNEDVVFWELKRQHQYNVIMKSVGEATYVMKSLLDVDFPARGHHESTLVMGVKRDE
ncbi:hypothetical protein [Candidatus Magnetobacterium casense]|uniref:Uncharacterized protein n=1 Tax=Candidatus Magnetobacterium casense TaxID=1455061 RepID=A0ABS6S0P0_9BACT|nr:hypothetical protein [Candidatus Magnetobacterium casensis]MBV6342417.1 hypothetical protein [Candidatus Magnetobacterium casensis]